MLEASVPQLCEYLSSSVTATATLQVFLNLAEQRATLLVDHVAAMKLAAHRHPHTVCLAAQVIAAVGKLSKVNTHYRYSDMNNTCDKKVQNWSDKNILIMQDYMLFNFFRTKRKMR